jgi:2Fe-2S ferredoxin
VTTAGRVVFQPLGIEADARAHDTILDVARSAGAPIGNSCGATGICTRCRVTILDGAESLTPPTTVEQEKAGENSFSANERLACQAVVKGRVVVTTGYWGGRRD